MFQSCSHVVLTSHPIQIFQETPTIDWGNKNPQKRGPVVGTMTNMIHKNTIGTHSGNYIIYKALATAKGDLQADHRPDLSNTQPVVKIGPNANWYDPDKIVTIDPWGAEVFNVFGNHIRKGIDIRPTMAITQARLNMPEIRAHIDSQRLKIDGKILTLAKDANVHKIAIENVWYLPGIAKRFGIDEAFLRRSLFVHSSGMYPELITRPDLKIFLPPIAGTTVYIFGDPKKLNGTKPAKITLRIHDECNGSDVFGSDICTCRPYLVHGIEEAIKGAQEGGVGIIVYFRKEGRALGEVTKFLVYNARKRQSGGDTPQNYFRRTECIAGVEDMRFQELMPDVLHYLGIKTIHRLVSMSDMKYNAMVAQGIKVENRISIPDDLVPDDAKVELLAKMSRGYFTGDKGKAKNIEKVKVKGRKLNE